MYIIVRDHNGNTLVKGNFDDIPSSVADIEAHISDNGEGIIVIVWIREDYDDDEHAYETDPDEAIAKHDQTYGS